MCNLVVIIFYYIMNTQKKIYIKKYELGSGIMVAVCDTELIGKALKIMSLCSRLQKVFTKAKKQPKTKLYVL
jgi:hypothetical protein